MEAYHLERFELLNDKQAKAVVHFLVFAAEQEDYWYQEDQRTTIEAETGQATTLDHPLIEKHDPRNDARKALEIYWKRFLTESEKQAVL